MQITLQINARWIITVDSDNRVLENHSLIIHHDKIIDILPQQEANKYQAERYIDLNDHALLPGFINAHTHAAMSLLKGLADDLPLEEWLNEHIWPAEAALANAQFVKDGSALAIAEMIRGGTTCFNDMYFFIGQTAAVAAESGIRANIGIPVIDFPTRWAKNLDEYINKGLAVRDQFSQEQRLSFSFAPHAPYTVSDHSLKRIQPLMNELGLTLHIHAHETADEVAQSLETHGLTPISRLNKLGLLGPDFISVHMTELNDEDTQLLVEHGAHVVHCPESNLKLASGFCSVVKLLKAGINVAIGTDGSASNNDIDMLGEIRSTALLAKGLSKQADALPAHQALRMATINGAKALGLEEHIGSLEIGKQADFFAINLNSIETQPVYDVVSTLIYSANRSQITDVWVAGKQLMENQQLTTLDEADLLAAVAQWQEKISPFHQPAKKAV